MATAGWPLRFAIGDAMRNDTSPAACIDKLSIAFQGYSLLSLS
jgi:hypothetical protein